MPLILRQAIAFLGVGAFATVCHYAVLVTLVETHLLTVVPASAVGALVGAIVGYQLNYRFAFNADTPHRNTISRYLIVAAVALGVNTVLMAVLHGAGALPYLIAQVITTGLVFALTFTAHRTWTFKSERPK